MLKIELKYPLGNATDSDDSLWKEAVVRIDDSPKIIVHIQSSGRVRLYLLENESHEAIHKNIPVSTAKSLIRILTRYKLQNKKWGATLGQHIRSLLCLSLRDVNQLAVGVNPYTQSLSDYVVRTSSKNVVSFQRYLFGSRLKVFSPSLQIQMSLDGSVNVSLEYLGLQLKTLFQTEISTDGARYIYRRCIQIFKSDLCQYSAIRESTNTFWILRCKFSNNALLSLQGPTKLNQISEFWSRDQMEGFNLFVDALDCLIPLPDYQKRLLFPK